MCGIVGIYNYANQTCPLTEDFVNRLRDTIAHRGPDDAGTWIDPGGKVGLGHRRLTIIDLSPLGHQPMCNAAGNIWITFNGEVWNYKKLRAELEAEGVKFRSLSDTEVIIYMYERYGVECLHKLDGLYAFAIYDQRDQTWFVVRDRTGIKPLYYWQHQGVFMIASEIKAILAHPLAARELDEASMSQYLTFKATPGPNTMFRGIMKLAAGHWLRCDRDGNLRTTKYWDAAPFANQMLKKWDEEEVVDQVRRLVVRAVEKRMLAADVPVGGFLSGGLDSSIVVALMAQLSSYKVNTYSVGITDVPGYDEFPFAREVAKRYDTNHIEVEIGRKEAEEYLPEFVFHQDEPLSEPVVVPLFYLTKLARQHGTPVILMGEGSDEQFLGYDSRIYFLRRYMKYWQPILKLPQSVLASLYAGSKFVKTLTGRGSRVERVFRMAALGQEPFLGSVAFSESDKEDILTETGNAQAGQAQNVAQDIIAELLAQCPDADAVTRVIYFDLRIRLAELQLMRVDKVTMSRAIEAREPFMDYELIEYSMKLPLELKLKNWEPKYLLKRAFADLVPESIIKRKKQPFAAPVSIWLRQGMDKFARDLIMGSRIRERNLFRFDAIEEKIQQHVRGEADYGHAIWNMMVLCAWYDRWFGNAR